MIGTVALYFHRPRSPLKRDFELMGRLTALAGIAFERKQSEAALRSSEARYRGLFENVIEGVYHADASGRLESVNPALVSMLGYETDEELLALPSTASLYVDPADRDRVLAALEAFKADDPASRSDEPTVDMRPSSPPAPTEPPNPEGGGGAVAGTTRLCPKSNSGSSKLIS